MMSGKNFSSVPAPNLDYNRQVISVAWGKGEGRKDDSNKAWASSEKKKKTKQNPKTLCTSNRKKR